jgi:hydrogenase nickel incorporation protein HypA/HybF
MHEGAVAAAIIQGALEVLEKERIATAKTVTVLIGRLHHVVPDVLQNHYHILKKEYPALVRSKLVIEIAPVRVTCRACGRETGIERPEFACSSCASTTIEITGGREMHLKEVIGEGRRAEGVGKREDKGKSRKAKGKSEETALGVRRKADGIGKKEDKGKSRKAKGKSEGTALGVRRKADGLEAKKSAKAKR